MAVRYTLDTNLYVDAARDPAARLALSAFSEAFAPWLYLTGIVAQERRAGVRAADERRLAGVRLVTRNVRDVARIAPLVPGFAFEPPWPR